MEVIAPTAMDLWKIVLSKVMTEGKDFIDDDGRICREVFNLLMTIEHPEVGIDEPIDYMRKKDKWLYPRKDELTNIIFNQYDLPLYDYTYGSRLFGYEQLDQINDYIIPLLRKKINSRRATAIIINPKKDLNTNNLNMPALISIHFKIRDKKLIMTATIRSNDLFIGWPANIYQLAMLQKYVAEKLEVTPGILSVLSFSAHIFKDYFEDIKEVLNS